MSDNSLGDVITIVHLAAPDTVRRNIPYWLTNLARGGELYPEKITAASVVYSKLYANYSFQSAYLFLTRYQYADKLRYPPILTFLQLCHTDLLLVDHYG
ncbi:hypothetical protein AAEY27_05355 [Kosakonia sp. BYX6]|uniref:Uncharacterized protein n=1 Tax=Kosakonia calanthes TaxID=3139408 RepID=A0ABZ3BDQ9_9ENTR